VNEVGLPVHVPWVAVSVDPTTASPEITGSPAFAGALCEAAEPTPATTANDNTIAVVTPIANTPRPVRRSVDTSSFDIRRPRIRDSLRSLVRNFVRSPGRALAEKGGELVLSRSVREAANAYTSLAMSYAGITAHSRRRPNVKIRSNSRQVRSLRHILVSG
jgi:hypothetical protein